MLLFTVLLCTGAVFTSIHHHRFMQHHCMMYHHMHEGCDRCGNENNPACGNAGNMKGDHCCKQNKDNMNGTPCCKQNKDNMNEAPCCKQNKDSVNTDKMKMSPRK